MIIIDIGTEVEITALTVVILQQFPSAGIERRGNKLSIENVEDTQANSDTINAIITGHDYAVAAIALKRIKIKEQSDKLLAKSAFIRGRQEEQKELIEKGKIGKTTLSDAKYIEWLVYRQALRDFSETCDLANPAWPTKPTA